MMTLSDTLNQRTYRDLRIVAGAYRLPFTKRIPKAQSLARLQHMLAGDKPLQRAYKRLPAEARRALRLLQLHDGRLPAYRFVELFGKIRRWRPWRDNEPRHPWRYPQSTAEHLWQLGFIHATPTEILLVEDVAALLPPLVESTPATWTASAPVHPQAQLCQDIAVLLGVLETDNVALLHGRWLPPATLKRINARLSQPDPLADNARSELQTERLRFLHYIAGVAGLLTTLDGWHKPTLRAKVWLAQDTPTAWQHLWDAWQHDMARGGKLWRAFRFDAVPKDNWHALQRYLDHLPNGQAVRRFEWATRLRDLLPVGDALATLETLDRPLAWAGVLVRQGEAVRRPHPVHAACQPATIQATATAIRLHLPAEPDRAALARLIGFGERHHNTLHLNAEAVRHALQHGETLDTLRGLLITLTAAALPPSIDSQLTAWAQSVAKIRLQTVTVLTTDSAIHTQLADDWRLRRYFGESLSPHHRMVNPLAVDDLHQRLARRGLSLLDERPTPPPNTTTAHEPALRADVASYLLAAVETYQALGDLVPQSVRVPRALTHWLKRQLQPEQLPTTTAARDEVVNGVRLLVSQQRAQAPQGERTLADVVRHAYQHQQRLHITYTSPTYGHSQRLVMPLELYEQDDVWYLRAWCHTAEAERTFRLDRIERATVESPPQAVKSTA